MWGCPWRLTPVVLAGKRRNHAESRKCWVDNKLIVLGNHELTGTESCYSEREHQRLEGVHRAVHKMMVTANEKSLTRSTMRHSLTSMTKAYIKIDLLCFINVILLLLDSKIKLSLLKLFFTGEGRIIIKLK